MKFSLFNFMCFVTLVALLIGWKLDRENRTREISREDASMFFVGSLMATPLVGQPILPWTDEEKILDRELGVVRNTFIEPNDVIRIWNLIVPENRAFAISRTALLLELLEFKTPSDFCKMLLETKVHTGVVNDPTNENYDFFQIFLNDALAEKSRNGSRD